ncbi:AMP-dependent synthetase and ligase [Lenzites betulinus]|nr:AMP-dependent synthetase and ligase [Lenzites betulinus]
MRPPFATLPSLLASRSQESDAGVRFLDHNGTVYKELSYANLYKDAVDGSYRLRSLCSTLQHTLDVDVVIASFANHEQHIALFWACCFAGIPVCPIPPLHPDPSRQAAFLSHLQGLFRHPIVVTDDPLTIDRVKSVTPGLQTVHWKEFLSQPSSAKGNNAASANTALSSAEISPDTIVCLMLTSGSTGNSKAVALRHSNLLSSIYGKIKHHGTTAQSQFLNWIAFDHVACVSEVHLQALAANANQYHVSPSAIIHRPLNLLEWCSRYGITYSFSPNFLIAQLCKDQSVATMPAGALNLSALVAFISGGEAVPIKTAIEFANLIERFGAPRNSLRAGFGMSETGAGCIYDTTPIPRSENQNLEVKYLSLGLCCDGVNVRVVSRETGEACPALEPGILQLKGPSVFREYYNNPQATADCFTADGWFITGDGALLDRDGNMHIVGREKDQININGVKHPTIDAENFVEAGDIDGVTRSTVMVCPMRVPGGDTETYVVFYLHRHIAVEGELSDEDAASLYATNRAIRDRCIVFCSQGPHVVLPLPHKCFTRTTLGKVPRVALLKGYLAGEYAALEERLRSVSSNGAPLTPWEQRVADVVAQLLDVDTSGMSRSSSLFELGMSSMHLVQLKYHLQEALEIRDIPIIDMLRHPELGQLCDYLEQSKARESQDGDGASRYNPAICLNPNGHKRPVFLVHPGVGEVLVFMGLAHIIHDRPIYALRARGFDRGEEPFQTFDEMVESYVSAIERQDPEGPYYVGGYSFGGAVAFEMAKVLEAKGKKVAWVGIFNLPPFIQSRMHELRWIEVLLNLYMFVALITPDGLDAARAMLIGAFPELADLDTEPAHSLQVIEWMLSRSDQARLQELQLRPYEIQRWLQVAYQLTCLGRTYLPEGAVRNALFTVFCAVPLPSMGTRESYKANRLAPWRNFSEGKFELVDVDGEHYTMLSETHVRSFAKNLTSALDRAAAL